MPTTLSTLCYIKKNKKTLMLHRCKRKKDIHYNKWNGLGGKFLKNETPEQCVAREVFEESNLRIIKPKLVGVLSFPNFNKDNSEIVFLFTAKSFKGSLKENSEGVLEWVNDRKLLKLDMWEGDKYFLNWMKKNRFFTAELVYLRKKLKSYKVSFY